MVDSFQHDVCRGLQRKRFEELAMAQSEHDSQCGKDNQNFCLTKKCSDMQGSCVVFSLAGSGLFVWMLHALFPNLLFRKNIGVV